MVAIHVNILSSSWSTSKHREEPVVSTNRRFVEIPPGGDAVPAGREYKK